MKTHGWVWGTLVALTVTSAFATESCRPKDNRTLIVGHTYKLDWFTTFRMKNSARLLGYKIKFKDLREIQADSEALGSIDGLLVPGGADINPTYYNKPTLPQEVQDQINEH